MHLWLDWKLRYLGRRQTWHRPRKPEPCRFKTSQKYPRSICMSLTWAAIIYSTLRVLRIYKNQCHNLSPTPWVELLDATWNYWDKALPAWSSSSQRYLCITTIWPAWKSGHQLLNISTSFDSLVKGSPKRDHEENITIPRLLKQNVKRRCFKGRW